MHWSCVFRIAPACHLYNTDRSGYINALFIKHILILYQTEPEATVTFTKWFDTSVISDI